MSGSLAFILGILESSGPACVAAEDFDGTHGEALRLWQEMGFLGQEPSMNPVPSCPHCDEGVPYRLGERFLCNCCGSIVDRRDLLLWSFDLEAFLRWIAAELHLRGNIRQVDEHVSQLGTWTSGESVSECFYYRAGRLSEAGRNRLAAYRNVLLLYGLRPPECAGDIHGRRLSLLALLRFGPSLTIADPAQLFSESGVVRFDRKSGRLWVGDTGLGEVPVGSKEFFLLDCLAAQTDQFVAYADIKHYVLSQTGSTDTTDEATFCHKLKNHLKNRGWVAKIDLLITTTNKGDGYRLRGHLGEP